MVWYFIGVYIINRTLHGRWRYKISLLVWKKIFHEEQSERVKYFSTLEEKSFVSPRGHVISPISFYVFYELI